MVQTGAPAHPDPAAGNPKGGRSIWGGAFDDEIRPSLRHTSRGVVSMANKGPGTNGSQFFITFDKASHLDGLNTIFGKVIGDDSLAVAESAGSEEPQAAVPARRRSEGRRAARVDVISGRPGGEYATIPHNRGVTALSDP